MMKNIIKKPFCAIMCAVLLTGCAAQPCDIESLRRIVSFTQKKLDKTLLLRGQDGTLRAVTDEDLAALLAALLA